MSVAFLSNCKRIVDECVRLWSTDHRDDNLKEFLILRLRTVRRALEGADGNLIPIDLSEELLESIGETVLSLERYETNGASAAYGAPRIPQARGASKYEITKDQLLFFKHCGFTVRQMGDILDVSMRTVERRLRAYGISLSEYAVITDAALDDEVKRVVCDNPRIGPNSVLARLKAGGLHIQRARVRESMNRTYPHFAAVRALEPRLNRRTYSVAAPNSLWHFDGNHKLIRWRIVIHGGIDGYSRLLTFLKASTNNRAETVLSSFVEAVATYGLPSRVRCDYGGENNDVCSVMEEMRGGNRASAIRGRSTHNQRIERAWVDVWCGVTNLYHDLFTYMEIENLLDPDNEMHVWALHFIFVPRLNNHLKLFQSQWNNHGLRTENHLSPIQLYVQGVMSQSRSDHTAIRDMFGPLHEDNVVLPGGLDDDQLVEVPASNFVVPDDRLMLLRQQIDPLDDTHDMFGLYLYNRTVEYLLRM